MQMDSAECSLAAADMAHGVRCMHSLRHTWFAVCASFAYRCITVGTSRCCFVQCLHTCRKPSSSPIIVCHYPDPQERANYRGITADTVLAKLYAMLLNQRFSHRGGSRGLRAMDQAGFWR